jgi:Fe2+ or Zn2+ uptake regulation protein
MSTDTVEGVIEQLRVEGRRITGARRCLVQALVSAPGHVTAEDLAATLHVEHPGVAASTVYRFLDDLEHLGIVVHVHLGHGPAVYHLAATSHVHLVCDHCGAVTELPVSVADAIAGQLRTGFNFEARFHHFSISGLCQGCHSHD